MNAASVILKGGLVCIDTDGFARPGTDTASFRCAGVAAESVTGGTTDGDKFVLVESDADYLFTATSVTQAMLNTAQAMYLVDDNTVDDAAGATNDIFVGVMVDFVSTTSCWVNVPGLATFPISGVTATASELNALAGLAANGGIVVAQERTFTETSGAGTYTGTVVKPAGATLVDIIVNGVALWDNAGTCTMIVGDTDDDGYYTAVNVKATDLLAGESISFAMAGGKAGAYIANSQVSPRYTATAQTINGIITTSSTGGTAGRTRMVVVYVLPTATAAAKV
ncbi:MAG: hypothetical protein IPK80_02955 [Nannocystis sp.]|nr:hypothetical protein [Nannocystis sp.]